MTLRQLAQALIRERCTSCFDKRRGCIKGCVKVKEVWRGLYPDGEKKRLDSVSMRKGKSHRTNSKKLK